MKKFATAYFDYFESIAKVYVIEADNEIDAMVQSVLKNRDDVHTRDWLESIRHNDAESFKCELIQCEISCDAVEI